jgi:hypothetical protein
MFPHSDNPADHPAVVPGEGKTGSPEASLPGCEISPLIALSQKAFFRDLPELLKKHYRKWVAYRGDERIGLSPSKRLLCQECLRRGLAADEFVVRSIEPQVPREAEIPPEV